MKNKRIGMLGAGIALSLAGAMGVGQVSQTATAPMQSEQTKSDFKATPPKQREAKTRMVNEIGGIPLMQTGEFGLTPREYGLRFGNGASKKRKNNYQRMAHNAKVCRRVNRS